MTKVLVSWVGKADVSGAKEVQFGGPLSRVLSQDSYDLVYCLHSFPKEDIDLFLGRLTEKHQGALLEKDASLTSPTHFAEIHQAIDSALSEIKETHSDIDLYLQISSGTSTMAAVSILVGKTKYPAKFIQSSKEQGVQEVEIPFDIAADFFPSLQQHHDKELSKLMASQAPSTAELDSIITQCPGMIAVKQRAAIIAQRDVPVLIYGETGTGKELFAKAIHNSSSRADKKLLVLNCGAIPSDLIDATLFGHTKGAFTGASEARKGYFEQADGSTLFLDEFGELPLDSQVRLLRVLQDGTFSPVGSTTEKKVDVRIIAATNRDLSEEIAKGKFREDLFYRVAIGVINLPPLRHRQGDLSILTEKLLKSINEEASKQPGYKHKNISVKARNIINQHDWPGNVRELHATLLRASLWQLGETISDVDIEQAMLHTKQDSKNILNKDITKGIDINLLINELSRHYIGKALEKTHGNKTKAAELLGLKNYQTLNNWMDRYGVKN